MIIGNPTTFAIESVITQAYSRLSFRALGFFVLHIGGRRYGVHAPDATLLALALDEIEHCISRRGTHLAPFSTDSDGSKIFDRILGAIHSPVDNWKSYLGMSRSELNDIVCQRRLRWHDPDEAFDDGTTVLQFDVEDRVRLIATNGGDGWRHNAETFVDIYVLADDFYSVLQQWRDTFLAEWTDAYKISEQEDGAEIHMQP